MSSNRPYFPEPYGVPDCTVCEREDCHSRQKFQRDKRHFSYLSGRCPRLPDTCGQMEPEDAELYAKIMESEANKS